MYKVCMLVSYLLRSLTVLTLRKNQIVLRISYLNE